MNLQHSKKDSDCRKFDRFKIVYFLYLALQNEILKDEIEGNIVMKKAEKMNLERNFYK